MFAYHVADTIVVKRIHSLETVIEIDYDGEDPVLAFSPDESVIAVCDFTSNELQLFRLSNGGPLGHISFLDFAVRGDFDVLKFVDANTVVAVEERSVLYFDLTLMTVTQTKTVGQVMAISNSHTVLKRDGRLFIHAISGGESIELKVLDVFEMVQFSEDGQRFVVLSEHLTSVFSIDGQCLCVISIEGYFSDMDSIGINSDGSEFITFSSDTVTFMSVERMKPVRQIKFEADVSDSRIIVTNNGTTFVMSKYSSKIAIINADDVQEPSRIIEEDQDGENPMYGLAVHDPYTVLL
jgi:hypothetical protein